MTKQFQNMATQTLSNASDTRITTVVFDYGGVLTCPIQQTLVQFCQARGLDPRDVSKVLSRTVNERGEGLMAQLEVGDISQDHMAAQAVAALGRTVDDVLGNESFGVQWFRYRTIDPTSVQMVRDIRARGYRTGMLTNNVAEWRPLWTSQFDSQELFDVVIDSSQERIRKPDPRIYETLLQSLNVHAGECLFVDDSEENCQTARSLGFTVQQWESSQPIALIDEVLQAHGAMGGFIEA